MEPFDHLTIEQLPRFVIDVNDLSAAAQFEPVDHALTFALEIPELPFTMMYAPRNETTFATTQHINGFTPDDDVDAFVFIFKRTTLGSMDSQVRAVLAISHTSGDIKGGAAMQELQNLLEPMLTVMRSLNAWLQDGDVYQRYAAMDPAAEMMLLKDDNGALSAEIISGRARPDLQCYELQLFSFGDSEAVTACRPYADETMEAMAREAMSLQDKIDAAEAGDPGCMEALAMLYLNGDDDTEADPEEAFYWMQRLADTGNPVGMFNIGLYYAKGFGTKRDFDKAAAWMEKAAAAGDEDAPASAELYHSMSDNLQKAEAGDAKAQGELAKAYMILGRSLDQAGPQNDYAESVRWARKAAAQGDSDAIWTLALAYEHGRGVPVDGEESAKYYKLGSEQGNINCMCSYGAMLMEGKYFKKNARLAFQMFLQSAEGGYGYAMANVARCYQFGNGCPANMKKAADWYEKAAEATGDASLRQKAEFMRMAASSDDDWDKDMPEEEEDD